MLKTRRTHDRLIFNMRIPIPGIDGLYIETGPWWIGALVVATVLINPLRLSDAYMRQQTYIGSDNGLLPGQHQTIIWTNAGMLLIWPLGTNFKRNINWNSYTSIRESTFG